MATDIKNDGTLATGLVAFWEMNEASDGSGAITRVDAHGANNLTDTNTCPSAAGALENAVAGASANSEHLNIADNAALSLESTNFSVACWVYPTSLASVTNAGIVTKDVAGGNGEWAVYITNNGGNRQAICTIHNGTGYVSPQETGINLADNTWYFLVARYDGSNISISVDNNTFVDVAETTGCRASTADMNVLYYPRTTEYLDGRVDAVGVWKKALTSGEVTSLYNSGTPLPYDASSSFLPTITII